MAERYSRVYLLPENLYVNSAPVLISAGALLKDNQTGNMIAQLKLKNISSKSIKAVTVDIIPYDTVGRELGEVKVHQFLDLNVKRDDYFGDQTPILLNDSSIRSYGVYVAEVAFSDNTIWTGEQKKWEDKIVPQSLSTVLADKEMQEQYRNSLGLSEVKCAPLEVEDLWICACGAVNRKEESSCHTCKRTLYRLKDELNVEKLRAAREKQLADIQERKEAERQEREYQAQLDKQRREEDAKAVKKTMKILVPAVCLIAVLIFVMTIIVIPNGKYNDAVALMDAGQYEEAIVAFEALEGHKDSEDKIVECNEAVRERDYQKAIVLMGAGQCNDTLRILSTVSDYKDARQLIQEIVKGMNLISAGTAHTVGLKSDGTVVAVGDNEYGQCDVDGWTDIMAVSTESVHTVGLKSDGTVVAVGSNRYGQCDVDGWTDIVAVSAGYFYTVGLKSDGTVVVAGRNRYGECDVDGWTDIVAVSAGDSQTIGLKSDGTVVAVGDNGYGQCDVDGWTDIMAVSPGPSHTVGLKSDGTVVAVGDNRYGQCDVDGWTDIMAVSAGFYYTVGLKSDGTVVTVGDNEYAQCDIDSWMDIVAVSAGYYHTVGLKSDGTVVVVGDNDDGQCDVDGWNLFR